MQTTDNYKKHTHSNPIQQMLVENYLKNLVKLLKSVKIESILDAGCGEGFTLNRIQKENVASKYEGIEFNPQSIKIAKSLYPKLNIKKATIYELPFKDKSFDLVMSTEVLEHLEDPRKGLKELIRVSKKYILISVPNEPFFMGANFIRGKNWSRLGNDIEHIQHWTFWQFENFVKQEKVKILAAKHPFAWTMLLLEKIS